MVAELNTKVRIAVLYTLFCSFVVYTAGAPTDSSIAESPKRILSSASLPQNVSFVQQRDLETPTTSTLTAGLVAVSGLSSALHPGWRLLDVESVDGRSSAPPSVHPLTARTTLSTLPTPHAASPQQESSRRGETDAVTKMPSRQSTREPMLLQQCWEYLCGCCSPGAVEEAG